MKIAEERGKRERAEVGLETARRELREAADARDYADRKLRHLNDELEQVRKTTQVTRQTGG
jgi:exonuclease VII small subunit